jgi:hypothetical protein
METVQTNIRLIPGDKLLVRAIAVRLRLEPRFREQLKALLEEDPMPALKERVDKLEEQVGWLMATLMPLRGPLPAIRVPPSSSGSAA